MSISGHGPAQPVEKPAPAVDAGWPAFLQETAPATTGPRSSRWWGVVTAGAPAPTGSSAALLHRLWSAVRTDPFQLSELIRAVHDVAAALDALPGDRGVVERVSAFAARVASDPRAFERDRPAGRLLERALLDSDVDRESLLAGVDHPALARDVLFAAAGLELHGSAATVLAAGVHTVITKDRRARKALRQLARAGLITAFPQQEVSAWRAVRSPTGAAYAVQGTTAFDGLVEALRGRRVPARWPVIACTGDRFNLAALLFFDACTAGNLLIHFAPDYTPAGLWLAASLRRRYGARCYLWRFDPAHYEQAWRAAESRGRLRPLTRRDHARLAGLSREFPQLVAAMNRRGVRAYQEDLLPRLIEDVLRA